MCYDNDVEKSRTDSAARSKASYNRDLEKSRTESAAYSKANYEKDIEASRALKQHRYAILYTLYNKTIEREMLHRFLGFLQVKNVLPLKIFLLHNYFHWKVYNSESFSYIMNIVDKPQKFSLNCFVIYGVCVRACACVHVCVCIIT